MRLSNRMKRIFLLIVICVAIAVASGGRSLAGANEGLATTNLDRLAEADIKIAEPDVATATRIDMSPQNASASVAGLLEPQKMAHYLVRGSFGQQLQVSLDALPADAYFSLYGIEDRRPYKRLAAEGARWSGILPSDQDYLISVATSQETADFVLSLELIQPSAYAQLDPGPIRIPPPRTASVVSGRIDETTQHHYLLQADAGETINLELKAANSHASFAIQGASDARTYKWLYDSARAWSFVAPTSQGYLLIVAAEGGSADYALTVTKP